MNLRNSSNHKAAASLSNKKSALVDRGLQRHSHENPNFRVITLLSLLKKNSIWGLRIITITVIYQVESSPLSLEVWPAGEGTATLNPELSPLHTPRCPKGAGSCHSLITDGVYSN